MVLPNALLNAFLTVGVFVLVPLAATAMPLARPPASKARRSSPTAPFRLIMELPSVQPPGHGYARGAATDSRAGQIFALSAVSMRRWLPHPEGTAARRHPAGGRHLDLAGRRARGDSGGDLGRRVDRDLGRRGRVEDNRPRREEVRP